MPPSASPNIPARRPDRLARPGQASFRKLIGHGAERPSGGTGPSRQGSEVQIPAPRLGIEKPPRLLPASPVPTGTPMSLRPVFTSFAGLAAMAVLAACSAQAKQEAAPPPAQVTITAVAFKELRQWDDFTGRLEAVDTVEIRPRVGGYVDGARFEEGARVHKGQVLFQIDPRPYQAEANRAEPNRPAPRPSWTWPSSTASAAAG
jgi:hypothetical protein